MRRGSMPSRDSDPARRFRPGVTIVPPTRWYSAFRQACLQQPDLRGSASFWLQAEGSLTRHLRLRCRHSFHVEIANEGFATPSLEEAQVLGIPGRQQAWV